MCALTGYRSADPYPRQTRSQLAAANDAADLRGPVAGLLIQIALLEALAKQVETGRAEDAISDAIEALQEAISALNVAADRVIDDANDEGI
jgi:hypothetical protein